MNNFTPEDLLEYYYQETSTEKAALIAAALENNWALQQKYNVICEAAERLDTAFVAPRIQTIQSILDYAAPKTAASI